LATFDPAQQSDEDVHAVLPELLAAFNQLDALTATIVASFDTRQLAERAGFQATRTWLTAHGRLSQAAASGLLARSRTLRQLPTLAAAAGAWRDPSDQVSNSANTSAPLMQSTLASV